MKKSASLTEAGSEWQILGLARSSQLSEEDAEAYLKNLSEYLEKTNLNKATDCAKYALVKAALGEEYSELMVPLADFDFSVKQGINGALYSLLAIDANNSEFEKAEAEAVQNSRQALIDYIIGQQQENGGWAFFGDAYEPDMTGMVIQALAPYYKKNDAVTNSVDKALELLSSTMNDDGTFTTAHQIIRFAYFYLILISKCLRRSNIISAHRSLLTAAIDALLNLGITLDDDSTAATNQC